jgi:hypothetical protein
MATVEPGAGATQEGRHPGALPSVVVIGGQKCGTSSLHRYLDAHPEIAMSADKELDFFGGPGFANWDRGLEWYRAQFSPEVPVRGESSPSYTAYPFVTDAPRRMHAVVPEAKLIYLVRDPIERLLSQYVHITARGAEPRSLEKIFADRPPEHTPFVTQSCYWLQLEQYLELFAAERILVVDQDDLGSDRLETMARIFRFLGVDDSVSSPAWERRLNRSSDKRRPRRLLGGPGGRAGVRLLRRLPERAAAPLRPVLTRPIERPALDRALRERLAEALRPDAERLRAHTGQTFATWSL